MIPVLPPASQPAPPTLQATYSSPSSLAFPTGRRFPTDRSFLTTFHFRSGIDLACGSSLHVLVVSTQVAGIGPLLQLGSSYSISPGGFHVGTSLCGRQFASTQAQRERERAFTPPRRARPARVRTNDAEWSWLRCHSGIININCLLSLVLQPQFPLQPSSSCAPLPCPPAVSDSFGYSEKRWASHSAARMAKATLSRMSPRSPSSLRAPTTMLSSTPICTFGG